MADLDQQEQFIELRAKGMSFAKISEELSVSKPTLIKWSKDLELEIKNMRAIELEALREKYILGKEKRLEILSDTFEKVRQEIARRDLSELPIEKLFSLNFKLLAEMKNEENTSLSFTEITSSLEMITLGQRNGWTV